LSKPTPRANLEEKFKKFDEHIVHSRSYWDTFQEVVKGNNYATAIARVLSKNKSIISRQLQELARTDLLSSSGDGVKQSYKIDWDVFTTFWIWEADEEALTASVLLQEPLLHDMLFDVDRTPQSLRRLRLTDAERRQLASIQRQQTPRLLEPVIPQLARIVQLVVETIAVGDVDDFWDAFLETSLSFRLGLPDTEIIKPEIIDITASRKLVEVLYNPKVQMWLKLQVYGLISSATIVENYTLKIAGLVKG